jgi:hypothetical protein
MPSKPAALGKQQKVETTITFAQEAPDENRPDG